MASARWCAYMQAQLEKEEREKERAQWEAEHTFSEWCPKCGRVLYIREGKYGEFLGCSGYPDCKFTKKYGREISNDHISSSNRTAKREVKSSPARKKEAECMPGRKSQAEKTDKKIYLEKQHRAQELVREYSACVETAKNACISQFRNDNQKRMEELRQSIATLENSRKSIYSIHFRKKAALQEQIANQQMLLTQISSDEYQKSQIQNIEKRAHAIFEQYQSDMDPITKEGRETLNKYVLEAYEQSLEHAQGEEQGEDLDEDEEQAFEQTMYSVFCLRFISLSISFHSIKPRIGSPSQSVFCPSGKKSKANMSSL